MTNRRARGYLPLSAMLKIIKALPAAVGGGKGVYTLYILVTTSKVQQTFGRG